MKKSNKEIIIKTMEEMSRKKPIYMLCISYDMYEKTVDIVNYKKKEEKLLPLLLKAILTHIELMPKATKLIKEFYNPIKVYGKEAKNIKPLRVRKGSPNTLFLNLITDYILTSEPLVMIFAGVSEQGAVDLRIKGMLNKDLLICIIDTTIQATNQIQKNEVIKILVDEYTIGANPEVPSIS